HLGGGGNRAEGRSGVLRICWVWWGANCAGLRRERIRVGGGNSLLDARWERRDDCLNICTSSTALEVKACRPLRCRPWLSELWRFSCAVPATVAPARLFVAFLRIEVQINDIPTARNVLALAHSASPPTAGPVLISAWMFLRVTPAINCLNE